jgi:chemotaxis protein methyltransferase CheR
LAILLAEKMNAFAFRNLEIHATDYDEPLLQKLRDGSYPYEELKRVPEAYFEKYFEPVSDHRDWFRVVENLRRAMIVQHHDLLSCIPVRNNFSLIVCKNVLLHFRQEQRVEVIRMFHQALEPKGLFITEHTQKMPLEAAGFFEQVGSDAQLFRKIDVPS